MKCVKFIRYYSQTKPLSPEKWKKWKEKERKIIKEILKSYDSDLDYLKVRKKIID